MGYDLRITRAQFWVEDEGLEIPVGEWLALVDTDPELRLAPEYGPYFAIWSGVSKLPNPWFAWENGNIVTKNPDVPVVKKMIELAQQLNATVHGEEGEQYGITEQGLVSQRIGEKTELVAPGPTLWWKWWL